MIYTVTFNPSLDYIINVDNLNLGKVNRSEQEVMYPGGKGINISIVLKNLGIDSTALGFVSGFTGDEFIKLISNFKFKNDFIYMKNGFSRINIKIKSDSETEINGQGPKILPEDLDEMYLKIQNLKSGDILILAGSVSNSLPANIYELIIEKLKNKNIKIIVDSTKDLLLNVLKYKPFLIKPNKHELEELFKIKLNNDEEIIKYAFELKNRGAKNILVSMDSKGALFLGEDNKILKASCPKGKVINSVGAGDSMVAGFLYGYLKYNNYEQALKFGISAGTASAFSEWLPSLEKINKIYDLLEEVKTFNN